MNQDKPRISGTAVYFPEDLTIEIFRESDGLFMSDFPCAKFAESTGEALNLEHISNKENCNITIENHTPRWKENIRSGRSIKLNFIQLMKVMGSFTIANLSRRFCTSS